MDHNELIRRIMATFLEELDEHVATLNRDLLALEKNPPPEERVELLHSLFRAAHSMKGASRAVDVGLIEQACHALEDLLVEVRDGQRELKKDHFTLLFRLADAIEEAGMRLREEQSLEDAPIAALLPEIQALDQHAAAQSSHTAAAAATTTETVQADEQSEDDVTEQAVTEQATDEETPAIPVAAAVAPQPAAAEKTPADTAEAPPAPQRLATAGSAAPASIRIDANKLDGLLAEAGELLVARQRIDLGVEELESLRDSIAGWRREWRPVETWIRESEVDESAKHTPPSKAALAELHQSSDRIREVERDLDRLVARARSDAASLKQVGKDIEESVHGARMLPFARSLGAGGIERPAAAHRPQRGRPRYRISSRAD